MLIYITSRANILDACVSIRFDEEFMHEGSEHSHRETTETVCALREDLDVRQLADGDSELSVDSRDSEDACEVLPCDGGEIVSIRPDSLALADYSCYLWIITKICITV
jgi:hypothetical protein